MYLVRAIHVILLGTVVTLVVIIAACRIHIPLPYTTYDMFKLERTQ